MRTTSQRGFVMVWAAAASAVVLMLSAAAFFALSSAMRRSFAMEIAADETLIAQDVLERAKYGERFGESFSVPSEVERNGRSYEIHFSQNGKMVNGISMTELTCEVMYGSGESFSLSTMVESTRVISD